MKQNMGIVSKHMGHLSTEIETIKKSLMETLELKSTYMKLKIHKRKTGLEAAEEKVSELEDKSIEII